MVTKENELELVRSGGGGPNAKRFKLADSQMEESDFMMSQEKLFTENNFFNNELFTRAMNMIMPTQDPDSKMMPIIDTNQLLQSIKQQQSILANGGGGLDLAGMSAMMPNMQQLVEDPELLSRFLNYKNMAVNAMGAAGPYCDTDCDSDDVQDLRMGGGSSGMARSTADSDETDDRDKEEDRVPGNLDDVHMKMNIEVRPDFMVTSVKGRLGEANQKSQIIPNDSMN